MGAVDPEHSGAASGINNAVARVAGLLAIAVFGVLFARTFEARVQPRLDRLTLSQPVREDVDRELPKMAGADIEQLPSMTRAEGRAVREAIDDSFVFAFRLVILGAAGLALAAAGFGSALRCEA